jgi:hypothetical protein
MKKIEGPMCYDREGKPLTSWRARVGIEKRVAETTLPDGKWVSTVWLGLDHGYGSGPPLIFETMVFAAKGSEITSFMDLYCVRYSTEAEARAGHERVVAAVKDGTIEMYGETI